MNHFVVVPAHNEEKNIQEVIRQIKMYSKNIVVVDDGSTDKTSQLAKEEGVIVLRHIINLGKGAAARTGCDFATESQAQQIILIDADGQHSPSKITSFLDALKDADVVFGYRKPSPEMPAVLRFGNWFISKITKYLYHLDLKDTQCGYRAFNTKVYSAIKWESSGYSMESEMIANVGKNKLVYKQIPIETIYSNRYKGTTIYDGFKIVFNLILWRFKKWT